MTAKMKQLQWLVRLGDGAVLFIQMAFWMMALFHLMYATGHVKCHPVEDERINMFWKIVLSVLCVPMMAFYIFPFLDSSLAPYLPVAMLLTMPVVAYYYRSRDAAGMWAAVAICGFYVLLVLVAVYGFDAMEPYGNRGAFDYWEEE